eukprot:2719242-Amphidinium_carterae.1
MVILHVPRRRDEETHGFLVQVWELCCARGQPCCAVMHTSDAAEEEFLRLATLAGASYHCTMSAAVADRHRPFWRRLLVRCNIDVEFPAFLHLLHDAPLESPHVQHGGLLRRWVRCISDLLAQALSFSPASVSLSDQSKSTSQRQPKRSRMPPLVPEFSSVVSVPAQATWQLHSEVLLDDRKGKVLELRQLKGDGANLS